MCQLRLAWMWPLLGLASPESLRRFAAGELAYHAYQFGAAGCLTGVGQFAPKQALGFVQRMQVGDLSVARSFLDRILPYRRLAAKIDNQLAKKHAMDLAGLAGGPGRPLLRRNLTAEERGQITAVLYETGLLENGRGAGWNWGACVSQ